MQKTIELIQRFQKGDKTAFNKILSRYQNYVQRLAQRYLKVKEDAEDLSQEVFLKLFHHLKGFQFKADLKTYLYRMVLNESYNYFKREKKHKKDLNTLEYNLYRIIAPERSADDRLIEKENFLELDRAINRLPQKYRVLILWKDFEKMSYRKISRKLGLKETTAKLRHHYAMKRLKQIYQEQGTGPQGKKWITTTL